MVCVAAFIILGICVLTVPIIRIFSKKTADGIVKLFKSATHCFTRRVTFRACDTSFKDDVKNGLLRKVVLRHPGWVKPLSISIEVASFLIIAITVWSLLVGVKSLVSLYVYGTCNPSNPSACSLDSTESCTIDAAPIEFTDDPLGWIGNWFGEFGNAIKAIPTRMKHWEATDYVPDTTSYYGGRDESKPVAVDIFDPGCQVCARSFKSQLERGFFDKYNVAMLSYPIKSATDPSGYKYPNSYLVTSYIVATMLQPLDNADNPTAWQIIERMFTGQTEDGDDYQDAFNMSYGSDKAEEVLRGWLTDFGYSDEEVDEIAELAQSDQVRQIIESNTSLVNDKIQTKKIPTMIFGGRRHDGEFTDDTKF